MSDQSKAIEKNVESIIALARVAFQCEYRGVKKNALNSTTPMDEWLCVFTYEGRPNEPVEIPFFTGIGLRSKVEDTPEGRRVAEGLKGSHRNSLAWDDARKKYCKPVRPSAASVLHSMVLDSDACNMSFNEWCSDFGYDTDSRKAYATYEACQKSGDQLKRLFNHDVIEQLREALQDY